MRTAFPLFLLLTFVVGCAAQTPATLQYEALPGVAAYSSGYLFSWNNPQYTEITFYHRDSNPVYSVIEHKDGVYHVGWAVDSDGVAAGVYETRPHWEGRIDLFDASGKRIRTINTGSYIPQRVVFAPDHTLWTVSYEAGNDGSKKDFNVLHHYARTGEELGQMLPWSQIAGDHNSYTALQPIVGSRWMYAADDRIGFEALSNYGNDTWIEVSYSGVLLGKYDLGQAPCYEPLAMTATGAVYAAIYKDSQFDGWAALDRSHKAWHKVTGYPNGRIIGSDGENLVFSMREGASTILQFVPRGTLVRIEPRPAGADARLATIQPLEKRPSVLPAR